MVQMVVVLVVTTEFVLTSHLWHCCVCVIEVFAAPGHGNFFMFLWVCIHSKWIVVRKGPLEQVHSLCVDSWPGDRLRLAKGPFIIHYSFC